MRPGWPRRSPFRAGWRGSRCVTTCRWRSWRCAARPWPGLNDTRLAGSPARGPRPRPGRRAAQGPGRTGATHLPGLSRPPALRAAEARRADLTSPGPWPNADVVVASYALAEIAADRQASTISELWNASDGFLVLIEPGTPAGYSRVLAARTALIAAGATV